MKSVDMSDAEYEAREALIAAEEARAERRAIIDRPSYGPEELRLLEYRDVLRGIVVDRVTVEHLRAEVGT